MHSSEQGREVRLASQTRAAGRIEVASGVRAKFKPLIALFLLSLPPGDVGVMEQHLLIRRA